jgi:hypothetical protein
MTNFDILYEKTKQEFDSAKTSRPQIPGGFKKIEWEPNTINLDYGGGKYNRATEYLKQFNVKNYIYDKYNRSDEENTKALNVKPDTVTLFNVLNVIREDEVIGDIFKEIKKISPKYLYITVYERNGDGKGTPTSNGYQRNMKTKDYLPLLNKYFNNISLNKKLITVKVNNT